MPITRMNRAWALSGIGNGRIRKAVNLLQPHMSTGYENNAASGTATGLNGTNRVRNSATLVSESNLAVDVVGNTTYLIKCRLGLALTAANGLKMTFAGGDATIIAGTMGGVGTFYTTGSNASGTAIGATNAIPFNVALTALNTSIDGGTSNTWTSFYGWFTAQFAVTGKVILQFAQSSAGATNTDILPGSFLIAVPLDPIDVEA
jgi:hypothetical protein